MRFFARRRPRRPFPASTCMKKLMGRMNARRAAIRFFLPIQNLIRVPGGHLLMRHFLALLSSIAMGHWGWRESRLRARDAARIWGTSSTMVQPRQEEDFV